MEQNKAERLNENVAEKMCSLCGDGAGEICSQGLPTHVETVALLFKLKTQNILT